MLYPPDTRLADIHLEVCRSPPLSPNETLVEIMTRCMEHPTLPNLEETDKIILALTHPCKIMCEFAGVTSETRNVLINIIEAKFDVLLEHLPHDKFKYSEVDGNLLFVQSRLAEFFEGRKIEEKVVYEPIYLEDKIRKSFNRCTCLTMCKDIMWCMRSIINEQTWQLQCWEWMPGRYNRDHPHWQMCDADMQTALSLSAAEALRAPAAAVAPAARTDHHFWSDDDDAHIQAAINASLSDQPAAAPAAVSSDAPCVVCNETHDLFAIVPCGHVCVCKTCAEKLSGQRCPLCRCKIEQFMQLFR